MAARLADSQPELTAVTPEMEGAWNAGNFRLMKSTADPINVGRGRAMKIDELADAVENGDLAACGLDVFEVERLPSDRRHSGLRT